MRITALQPQKKNPDRIDVYVDGELRLEIAADLAFSEHLRAGDEVTEDVLEALARRDEAWRAREAALVLLSFRPRTAAELHRRLRQKGFAADVAEACVAGLGDLGVVDDAAFAQAFVRDRVRLKPTGARRLARELRAKGVDADTVEAAIGDAVGADGEAELDLARRAAAKWRPRAGEDRARARRRLHGFLARRGFGPDAIRAVLEEMLR
jgi:regulatory protein